MPLVVVSHADVSLSIIDRLRNALPESVAEALSAPPDAELSSTEISVYFQKMQPGDVYTHDIEIIIWANDYPERREIVDRAAEKIRDMVEGECHALHASPSHFTWILLQRGAFAERTGPQLTQGSR